MKKRVRNLNPRNGEEIRQRFKMEAWLVQRDHLELLWATPKQLRVMIPEHRRIIATHLRMLPIGSKKVSKMCPSRQLTRGFVG